MKKILSIILALALICTLAACSGGGSNLPDAFSQVEEDGQNPVMNFIGVYASGRCAITVEASGSDGAKISVHWGSSAFESAEWEMTGTFDEETLTVNYTDGVYKEVTYDEEGVSAENVIYENGKGSFTFTDGDPLTLTWNDAEQNAADGMVFEYALID